MKPIIKVSGLIDKGLVSNTNPAVLPKFKNQEEYSDEKTVNLPIDWLIPNPYQPRQIFPEDEIISLANSISEVGLLQPIAVRKCGAQQYQIIAGERRFRAFKKLNKTEIPCVLFTCDDGDMAVWAISENVSRENLSDYEIAQSIRKIEKLFPTKQRIAEALGMQRQDMYRYFAYDSLPEFVLDKLNENPRLLGRNAADQIKRTLSKYSDKERHFANEVLLEALQLLENAELDQTKVAGFISNKVKNCIIDSISRNKEEFFYKSRKIGYFSASANGIVIKITNGILSNEQTDKLKELVNNFIKSDN